VDWQLLSVRGGLRELNGPYGGVLTLVHHDVGILRRAGRDAHCPKL
jgi:hypothetical protein